MVKAVQLIEEVQGRVYVDVGKCINKITDVYQPYGLHKGVELKV